MCKKLVSKVFLVFENGHFKNVQNRKAEKSFEKRLRFSVCDHYALILVFCSKYL